MVKKSHCVMTKFNLKNQIIFKKKLNIRLLCAPTRTHFISGLLTLDITIFGLNMMVKSGLEFFYFEIEGAPSELLLPSLAGISEGARSILR